MANRPRNIHWGVIPPKEVNVDVFQDILSDYLRNHSDCTLIKIRKKVPNNITGLVLEVGLQDPLSMDIYERYRTVAEELAELTHEKITLIPTEIGIECHPKQEE